MLLANLLVGLPVMVACLMMQLALVVAVIRLHRRHQARLDRSSFWSMFIALAVVMLILVVGNMGQVAAWAILFLRVGEFEHFREAFYHSAVNFSTLGYGDIVMSSANRLLGPLESLNGALMIGLSTATLMAAFQKILELSKEHPGKS